MDTAISSAYRRLRIPDAERYWVEMVKCRVRLPGPHRRLRLRDRHRRRPLRGRLRDRARHQPLRLHLRPRLRRALRGHLPPRERRRAGRHPRPQALRQRAARARDRQLRRTTTATRTSGCCRPERGLREKIAVVGAGVGGLTVAHDLAQVGYKVTVFEANPEPGGMLTVGVPALPPAARAGAAEIQAILSLGVELRLNARVGSPDFTIADLRREGYKAIFLGIGLPGQPASQLPGADLPGVVNGIEFLHALQRRPADRSRAARRRHRRRQRRVRRRALRPAQTTRTRPRTSA